LDLNDQYFTTWSKQQIADDSSLPTTTHMVWQQSMQQKGDVIALFLGCEVPIVLRNQRDGTYKVISRRYLHGIMEGEAMEDVEAYNRGLREIGLT
jgi:hypothetical protein